LLHKGDGASPVSIRRWGIRKQPETAGELCSPFRPGRGYRTFSDLPSPASYRARRVGTTSPLWP